MAQTVEYIRYRIPADGTEAFEAAYQRAQTTLAAAPQCIDYELARCDDTETDGARFYVLRIVWTSKTDHLEGFRGSAAFQAFLAEVGPFVSRIEEMRHYTRTKVRGSGGAYPSLYDWAGGASAFERLAEAFYRRVGEDELLAPLFADMDPSHPQYVALWLGEVFGGPDDYSKKRGGYPTMLAQHRGKAITEPQRRRWVGLLIDAADEVGLPDDPEFRSAFLAYIEWGTRLALANSQPDSTPPQRAPVPHWGWGVAPPYIPEPAKPEA